MKEEQVVNMYRGKRVEDMTREELIEAVVELGQLYNQHLAQTSEMLKDLSSLPR